MEIPVPVIVYTGVVLTMLVIWQGWRRQPVIRAYLLGTVMFLVAMYATFKQLPDNPYPALGTGQKDGPIQVGVTSFLVGMTAACVTFFLFKPGQKSGRMPISWLNLASKLRQRKEAEPETKPTAEDEALAFKASMQEGLDNLAVAPHPVPGAEPIDNHAAFEQYLRENGRK